MSVNLVDNKMADKPKKKWIKKAKMLKKKPKRSMSDRVAKMYGKKNG